MTTLPKILLTASIVSFVIGLTGPGSEFAWGLLRPMGAVLFILFFVTNLLAKEVAKFDEECAAELALVASLERRAAPRSASRSAERPNESAPLGGALAR